MLKGWTESIQKEYPKLLPESKFTFSCHKGLSCFTRCCADVNILLTPYDVLRMKKALNLPSEEFLEKYTVSPLLAGQDLPLVLLKMRDDARKSCPFVTQEGCSIYQDRPWSCRMFPLGVASSKAADKPDGIEFWFNVAEDFSCLGTKEKKEWTVSDWWKDQEIDLYDKKCESYKEITLHRFLREKQSLGAAKAQMFYLACYDLDRFRRLLLESSFFDRFQIEDEVVEKIKNDDEALLEFGFDWLKFSLFGEKTFKIKQDALKKWKTVPSELNNVRRAHNEHGKDGLSKKHTRRRRGN